jgi:hypothetical protein
LTIENVGPPLTATRGALAQARSVIASEAKQSIWPHKERMDCFVASLLAMTVKIIKAAG